jgi:hypothetical protein
MMRSPSVVAEQYRPTQRCNNVLHRSRATPIETHICHHLDPRVCPLVLHSTVLDLVNHVLGFGSLKAAVMALNAVIATCALRRKSNAEGRAPPPIRHDARKVDGILNRQASRMSECANEFVQWDHSEMSFSQTHRRQSGSFETDSVVTVIVVPSCLQWTTLSGPCFSDLRNEPRPSYHLKPYSSWEAATTGDSHCLRACMYLSISA